MKLVYLGLGSNMGDREATASVGACRSSKRPICGCVRASGVYETEPIGLREQAWFLNLVAEFETDLFPAATAASHAEDRTANWGASGAS